MNRACQPCEKGAGGRNDELEILPLLDGLLAEAEQDVGVDGALMRLVEHDARVPAKHRVGEDLRPIHF